MTLNSGVISKLRTSTTLHEAIVNRKPQAFGLGDFANKAMYDEPLILMILLGQYRELQAALEADWGPINPTRSAGTTDVATKNERGGGAR